jgi:hypothetical protein
MAANQGQGLSQEEMKRLKRQKKTLELADTKLETIDSHVNEKLSRNRKNFDVHGQSELDHGFNVNSSMDLDG